MSALKEDLIREIQGITDEKVLASIQNLLHSVEDATRYIKVNEEQRSAFKEAKGEYQKGDFHSTDELFDDLND